MPNPVWITSENVHFNGTLNNAAVLKTDAGVRSLILWDTLSEDDKSILTQFITNNGGALPLAGPTAGSQIIDFGGSKSGGSTTGLSNVATATAGKATVDLGAAKLTTDPSGLSASAGTKGYQIVNYNNPIVAGTSTTLVPTAGYQFANFSVAKAGGDATGLFTPATSGSATIAFTDTPAITPTTVLGIAAASYTIKVAVDGGTATVYTVSATGIDTMTSMAVLLDAQIPGATVAAIGNAWIITSSTTGATSSVVVTVPAGSGTDLIGAINTAWTSTNGNVSAGGTDIVYPTYTATVVVDGVSKAISILGSAALTFTTLLAEINTDLGAAAVASISGGNIKITSATTSTTSSVAITAGTLFPALTSFSTIATAVAGTGSLAALTATVVVDGVSKSISILPAAIATFGDVINEINTDLGAAAVASISGGDIRITSATYGVHSTVVITDGTLFAALPSFAFLLPTNPGGSSSRTYSSTVYVDGNIRTINFTGAMGDTIQHVIDEINTDLNSTATAGYQDVQYINFLSGSAATGLVGTTTYTATITVDGVAKSISVLGSAAQTVTTLLAEINTDLGAAAVASINAGHLRITSATTGALSLVSIADVTLFKAVSGLVSISHAVPGKAAVTYATAALTGGDIVITSATTGLASSVLIHDVGALFSSLTGYVGISYTASTAPTLYTANVIVDGVSKPISIQGSAAQTFTTLLSEINTDLGAAATATITGGNIKITSATTGLASKVVVLDGTLFKAVHARGFTAPVSGIVDLIDAAHLQKTPSGTPIFTHFKVLYVGTKPHVPTTPAVLPKTLAYTYFNGTVWKYLQDDTNVNP
jgi:hypothetical protein